MKHNTYRHRTGFPFGYFIFGLFLMMFFGWKLFFIVPFLMMFVFCSRGWGYDSHDAHMDKPKRKPKYDEWDETEYV